MRAAIMFLLAVSLMITACSKKELAPPDYVKWVEDKENGLCQHKKIGDIEFTVQYKPGDYVLLKEEGITSAKDFQRELKLLGDMQYYTMIIRNTEETDPLKYKLRSAEEYYGRIKYCSFDIQHDLKLVEGTDTLDCALVHFERNYGIAPEIRILLGFQGSGQPTERSFIYNDRMYGSGPVMMNFSSENLANIPQINFKD